MAYALIHHFLGAQRNNMKSQLRSFTPAGTACQRARSTMWLDRREAAGPYWRCTIPKKAGNIFATTF
jgi:hypothetical protein